MKNTQEENTDVIAEIMTKLSLDAILKYLVKKPHNNVHYDMKQLHFRDILKPIHWK